MNCTASGSVMQTLNSQLEEMVLSLEEHVNEEARKLDEIEQEVMRSLKRICSEIVNVQQNVYTTIAADQFHCFVEGPTEIFATVDEWHEYQITVFTVMGS